MLHVINGSITKELNHNSWTRNEGSINRLSTYSIFQKFYVFSLLIVLILKNLILTFWQVLKWYILAFYDLIEDKYWDYEAQLFTWIWPLIKSLDFVYWLIVTDCMKSMPRVKHIYKIIYIKQLKTQNYPFIYFGFSLRLLYNF